MAAAIARYNQAEQKMKTYRDISLRDILCRRFGECACACLNGQPAAIYRALLPAETGTDTTEATSALPDRLDMIFMMLHWREAKIAAHL